MVWVGIVYHCANHVPIYFCLPGNIWETLIFACWAHHKNSLINDSFSTSYISIIYGVWSARIKLQFVFILIYRILWANTNIYYIQCVEVMIMIRQKCWVLAPIRFLWSVKWNLSNFVAIFWVAKFLFMLNVPIAKYFFMCYNIQS